MNSRNKNHKSDYSFLIPVGVTIILFLVWEIASRTSERAAFLFSSPSQVWDALLTMATAGTLFNDIATTASEALLGITAGTVLGSAVGLALWLSRRATKIATPFILVAANFPVFALAPAAIVWLGIGMGMKVFLAAFATFFISLNLTHQGAKLAHERFGGVFDGFNASRKDIYLKVIVPGALDSVFSSMRVNVGLGILGAFIGEFIASERGLGHAIIRASGLYQIDRVFAASFCIIGLAVLFDLLARGIQQEKLFLARLFGLPRHLRKLSRELEAKQTQNSQK